MRPFSICPPLGSRIPSSGRLCMPALSVCFWTPRLSLGHPGSFTSVHDLKCMRTQTAPLFNVPRGRRGTTTRVVHPYPHSTCPSRESNPDRRVGRPTCLPLHHRTRLRWKPFTSIFKTEKDRAKYHVNICSLAYYFKNLN